MTIVYNCHKNITVREFGMRESFAIATDIFRENKGILRRSKATSLGINPKTLSDMVGAGVLVREGRGLYRLADLEPPGNPDIVYVSQRVPDAVICLISALSFFELTTQIPYKVYIALPREKTRTSPRIEYPPIEVVWLSRKPYHAGIENRDVDGFNVAIYCREKTLADCFKFRNKIGTDVAVDALKDYMRSRNRDIPELTEYARIDRVERIMLPYIEALA
jgi:predicted transcriptional regulator of viral defense system